MAYKEYFNNSKDSSNILISKVDHMLYRQTSSKKDNFVNTNLHILYLHLKSIVTDDALYL